MENTPLEAESLEELARKIRAWTPKGLRPTELQALRSLTYTQNFTKILPRVFPCKLTIGDNPPDFILLAESEKIAIEATSLTTPQFEVFKRERLEGGPHTSTLASGRADKDFWQKMREYKLPDDSRVKPATTLVSDALQNNFTIASQVIAAKIEDLRRYHANYSSRILLVSDELSCDAFFLEPLAKALRQWLLTFTAEIIFNQIIIVCRAHGPNGCASACLR